MGIWVLDWLLDDGMQELEQMGNAGTVADAAAGAYAQMRLQDAVDEQMRDGYQMRWMPTLDWMRPPERMPDTAAEVNAGYWSGMWLPEQMRQKGGHSSGCGDVAIGADAGFGYWDVNADIGVDASGCWWEDVEMQVLERMRVKISQT